MDHDHGHWFVVGLLGGGVLMALYLALRSVLQNPDGAAVLSAVVIFSASVAWLACRR